MLTKQSKRSCIILLVLTLAPFILTACGHKPVSAPPPAPPNDQQFVSRTYVSGVSQCGRFPLEGATNRCSSFAGCEARGRAFLEEKLRLPNLPAKNRAKLTQSIGNLLSNSKELLPQALDKLLEAQKIISEALGKDSSQSKDPELESMAVDFLAMSGILRMRLAEIENHKSIASSIDGTFPRIMSPRYAIAVHAEAARTDFLSYLQHRPDDEQIKWLLNILSMSLGHYPDKVPQKWLISPDILSGKEDFPRFPDVAVGKNLSTHATGSGSVAVDDFNGDGWLDIVIAPKLECLGLIYLESNRHGEFIDKSKESGLAAHQGVRTLLQADFDNDGHLDLYLARGGFLLPADKPRVSNTLLRNNGRARFTDVTEASGVKSLWSSGGSANWVDFDKDGWLDLFVCNYDREIDLFRNVGGRFHNIASELSLKNPGKCKGSAWGDVDNDGWPDLVVMNYNDPPHRHFRNLSGKAFAEVKDEVFTSLPRFAYTPMMLDINNDGHLDIFISPYNMNVGDYARALQGLSHHGDSPRLLLNKGGGTFADQTREFALNSRVTMAKGANFGDLNGDGYLDIVLGADANSLGDLGVQTVLINRSGKALVDVSSPIGMGFPRKGNGLAFADLENRGAQDLIQINGGSFDADMYSPSLYRNPGFGARWLNLKLVGKESNRSAIGARVHIQVEDKSGAMRSIYKTVSSGGAFGSNPLRLEFGLGDAKQIRELTIDWPRKNDPRQSFKNIVLDQTLTIIEGDNRLRTE